MSEGKFCPSCGTQNVDTATFCKGCGTALSGQEESSSAGSSGNSPTNNGAAINVDADAIASNIKNAANNFKEAFQNNAQQGFGSTRKSDDPNNPFKPYLMDTNEKIVSVLGNSYLQNFLTGQTMDKGFSVVTDKRVYFRGTVFFADGEGKLRKQKVSNAVNIRDVTGVCVTYISPIHYIVIGVLLAIVGLFLLTMQPAFGFGALVAAGVAILRYFFKRYTLLEIQYAGGAIGFDAKWYSDEEGMVYQRSLFLTKDSMFEAKQ